METSCRAKLGVIMSHSVLSTTMYFIEGEKNCLQVAGGVGGGAWRHE